MSPVDLGVCLEANVGGSGVGPPLGHSAHSSGVGLLASQQDTRRVHEASALQPCQILWPATGHKPIKVSVRVHSPASTEAMESPSQALRTPTTGAPLSSAFSACSDCSVASVSEFCLLRRDSHAVSRPQLPVMQSGTSSRRETGDGGAHS